MDIIVSAPGKVILHGEHSVVYGKPAIAASLNLRSYIHLTPTNDGKVSVNLPSLHLKQSWEITDLEKIAALNNDSPDEVMKMIIELVEKNSDLHGSKTQACSTFLYLYIAICGRNRMSSSMKIQLYSKLPIGAGLGSSASFSVCLATALLLNQNMISDELTVEDRKLIESWSFQGERIIHGNPSGIDNAVATYGGAIRFQSGEILPLQNIPKLRILLVSTGVPRSTKTLVANVRDKYNRLHNIMTPVLEAMASLTVECEKLFVKMSSGDESCTLNFTALEEMIDMNQHLLQTIGVSHPELDKICDITKKYGLHSKLTGAGGGGCAFTLLTPNLKEETLNSVIQELKAEGFHCFETDVGTSGVLIETEPPEKIF
ncbi:hypothetical protein ACF0H5_017121 [Mactra antiquata]